MGKYFSQISFFLSLDWLQNNSFHLMEQNFFCILYCARLFVLAQYLFLKYPSHGYSNSRSLNIFYSKCSWGFCVFSTWNPLILKLTYVSFELHRGISGSCIFFCETFKMFYYISLMENHIEVTYFALIKRLLLRNVFMTFFKIDSWTLNIGKVLFLLILISDVMLHIASKLQLKVSLVDDKIEER